jgi:hypothetical protein
MPIAETEVTSLGQLIDQLTPREPDPATGRRRDDGVYRGGPLEDASLLTSLDRLGGIDTPHGKVQLEAHILRNYIRYSRPHLRAEPVDDWEQLVSAQHHGVPTRLLDWTYSPLIAAFFATRPRALERGGEERDGVIWRLGWQELHRKFSFPPLSLQITDLATLPGLDGRFTPWDLFEGRAGATAFACLLEPPSLDDRIVSQAAVFTLMTERTCALDEFLAAHGLEGALSRWIIPASAVARVRDQLDLVGVDERRLFPDLDGVAAALRRYYA